MSHQTFQANQWIIIQQANEAERLVYLKAGTQIDMGRYGRFTADLLYGQRSGGYFTIERDGTLQPLDASMTLSLQTTDLNENTNDTLFDHNDSQKLTAEQIEELKEKAEDAHEVVQSLVEGSQTFKQKNAYSQLKYVQRKERKYLRWIRPMLPNTRLLSAHFMAREGSKILDLRLDTLSQLLCLANLHHNSKVLLWDDSKGFVAGSLIKRLPPPAQCVVLHTGMQWQPSMLIYHNLSQAERERMLCYSLLDMPPHPLRGSPFNQGSDDRTEAQLEIHLRRHEAREARRQLLRTWMETSAFTSGILVANAQTDILSLIPQFPLLGSGRLVIYCPYRECLLQPFHWLRSNGWVDVQLTDSWLRPYQTAAGRLHPEMSCQSHSGYLLTAIRILN